MCHHQNFTKDTTWNLNLKLKTKWQWQFMMIKRNRFDEFHKGSNSELPSTINLVVMREHRVQLALVWLASMSRRKNNSFKFWTRLTPGRGPVLSHWDRSLGNCCWISLWSKRIKMHSTKLALGSCLYFKAGRNANIASWPGWSCFPWLSLCHGCSHPVNKTEHGGWCRPDVPWAQQGWGTNPIETIWPTWSSRRCPFPWQGGCN